MSASIQARLWKDWKEAIKKGRRLKGILEPKDRQTDFVFADHAGRESKVRITQRKLYAVGFDVVGYSTRSLAGQLYLTTTLFAALDAACDMLRLVGWIAQADPLALLPTGDGALVVFAEVRAAFAFLMTVNMYVENANRGPEGGIDLEVEANQPSPILPCETRIALATGNLVEVELNGAPNFVGEALVACSRILSASKGAHFLVQDRVMAELFRDGGINELQLLHDAWDWRQEFHWAHLAPRKVKTGTFSFWNVFGHYDPLPLFNAILKANPPPRSAKEAGPGRLVRKPLDESEAGRQYAIGSHDVTAIVI